jgi:thiamine biosynthesis protein ThiC
MRIAIEQGGTMHRKISPHCGDLALNILRAHPDDKSMRRKIKRAGWDDALLMNIISHFAIALPLEGRVKATHCSTICRIRLRHLAEL